MKITSVDVDIIASPFKIVFKTSWWTSYKKYSAIVRINTDEGVVGIGESTPLQTEFGEPVETIPIVIKKYLEPALKGKDPLNIEELFSSMHDAIKGHLFAKCAIDFALHDLVGKILGVPTYKFLGGRVRDRVPVAYVLGIKELDLTLVEVGKAIEEGFPELKMKADRDWRYALERLKAIREEYGYELPIRIDANSAWPPELAIKAIKKMERYELQCVEQPVPPWNIDGLARVTKCVDTPIMADEAVITPQDALTVIEKEAADIINIKIGKHGGIYYSKYIEAIAESAGIPCVVGSMVEGSIGTMAGAHFAASSRVVKYACDLVGPIYREKDVVRETVKIRNGCIELLEKPGLGLELDLNNLKELKVA